MLFCQFLATTILEKNKFKISAPTWKGKFELSERSYIVSDIENYFENISSKA